MGVEAGYEFLLILLKRPHHVILNYFSEGDAKISKL